MPDYRHDAAKVSAVGGKSQYKESAALVRANKRMHFCSLHHHSTYSYLDGYGLPETHVRRAAELNMPALALTEHGNVSSHVKLEQAANKFDVKPIFGCELYTGEIDHERRTKRKNHLTLLAENAEGYRNLLRVVSRGWSEGFYYEPTVDGRILSDHRRGIVVLSGCLGSLLATSLIGGKNIDPADASYRRAKEVAQRFKRVFGDGYYLECQAFPELEKTRSVNSALAQLSEELKIPLAATLDCHYTQPDEADMQMILHNVRGGGKQSLEEQARNWGYDVKLCPPPTDNDIYSKLRHTGLSKQQAIAAIMNTEEIAQRCNVTLPKLEQITFPVPPGYEDAKDVWLKWLREGWEFRGIDRLPNRAEYVKRVKYEMDIIDQKGFFEYFLVVSDIVKYAKDNGIPVGPARGSAAASLVCFLLRITEVNPMLYPNLVFERFIDISREDLPDIDLDFDDELRSKVRAYAVRRYGADKVSNIGTFTTYKSKNSLDDIARVYNIPKWEIETVKDLMIERSSGDLRASSTIEDTIDQFEDAKVVFDKHPDLYKSAKLEGNLRGMGVHACGLIISNRPITDICAVYQREKDGGVTDVISLDKYDAEYLGMLKIDVLGLSTMGMLRMALKLAGLTLQQLYDIPLDDAETLEGFRRNDVTGIFQFDGRAMRFVNGALRPDSFEEVCHVNALARPGPLHNQATTEYVEIKFGKSQPERLHPLLDDITAFTNYQIVYQEQILRIVREIGGFDWTAAGYIRKIISRKLGEQEFNRQWERFRDGALEREVPEEIAKRIWGACITAGSYAFNLAHSLAYGMLAWWTMYMKIHHPIEFYLASLIKNPNKENELLRDAAKHGIKVNPPHPRGSGANWGSPKPNTIQAGFIQIPGIGEKTAQAIETYRSQHSLNNWTDLINVKGIGPKTIIKMREFVEQDDPFRIHYLRRVIETAKAAIEAGKLGDLPVPTHATGDIPFRRTGVDETITWLGVIQHRNVRDLFEVNMSRTGVPLDPETVRDPHLNEWMIMQGADDDGILTVRVDRWRYPEYRKQLWDLRLDHDLVLATGIKPGNQSVKMVFVKKLWILKPR